MADRAGSLIVNLGFSSSERGGKGDVATIPGAGTAPSHVVVYHLRAWNLTTQSFERWTGGTPSTPNPSGQPITGIAIERVQHAV